MDLNLVSNNSFDTFRMFFFNYNCFFIHNHAKNIFFNRFTSLTYYLKTYKVPFLKVLFFTTLILIKIMSNYCSKNHSTYLHNTYLIPINIYIVH